MRLDFKEISTIIIPYFFGIAAIYLFGYWGAFNINILEYAALSDVAKLSIYPLLTSFVFFGAGILSSELLISPSLPPGGGNNTTVGRFGLKHARLLLAAMLALAVGLAIFGQEPSRWFIVAPLVGIFSIPLQHNEWIIEKVPDPRIRSTLLSLALLLPGLSFAYGRLEAYLIKQGHPTNIVDIARSKLPLEGDPKHPVAVIGFVGGTYVLYESKNGQVVFAKQSDTTPFYVSPKNH